MQKINIRIGNNSVPVSMVFLNALSVMKFGAKYGPKTKKQVNELIRGLMADEVHLNTQTVYQKILLEVLPKTKRELVLSNDKQTVE